MTVIATLLRLVTLGLGARRRTDRAGVRLEAAVAAVATP
jgi:hypothetical protein